MSVNKFKDGDMVYLIGFDCLKPRKLLTKHISLCNNGYIETNNRSEYYE